MRNFLKIILLFLAALLVGCAPIETYSSTDQPTSKVLYADIGGVVLKLRKSRDLPNIFGKADIWGGKVDEGFKELRFIGVSPDGTIKFRLVDVDVMSNEDVFTRYMGNKTTFKARTTVNPYSNTATTQGSISKNEREANRKVLPPNVTEFSHNYKTNPELVLMGKRISIIDASPANITYSLNEINQSP
jgi:hypothetical protein